MYKYNNKYISEKRKPDYPGYSDKQHRGNEGEPMSGYGISSLLRLSKELIISFDSLIYDFDFI